MMKTPINTSQTFKILLFTLCINGLFAQNLPNYEQAYGYMGEFGSIECVEPLSLAAGQYLLGGQLNGEALVTRVNQAGQSLDHVILPFLDHSNARVTDIARINAQTLAATGVCTGCGGEPGRQAVFLIVLDAGLDETATLLLNPTESQANFDNPLVETDGTNLYLAFNDEFFGGSHHVRSYDQDLVQRWAVFHNLGFVEAPAGLIYNNGNLWLYAEEWNGFESLIGARLVRFDAGGQLINHFPYPAFGKQAALLADGNFALTAIAGFYPDPAKIKLSIVSPEDGAVLDSVLIGTNPGSIPTALTALPNGELMVAVREAAFFEDPAVLYRYNPANLDSPVKTLSILGDRGAIEREAFDLFPISANGDEFIAVGTRHDASTRGMFLSYHANPVTLTAPAGWSNDICGTNLLMERAQSHYPSVLPWVHEKVVYEEDAELYNGQLKDLVADLYVPFDLQTTNDPAEKRPLMVIVHGGGFLGGNEDAFSALAILFAETGYVTASINYRLGVADGVTDLNGLCEHPDEAIAAMYRATQDTRKAVNFLYDNADQYHIDRNHIFVLGHSAGAVNVLNSAFLDQDEIDQISPGLTQELGPLPPKPQVKAYIPWAGATDISILDQDDNTPMFFIHGTCDPLVTYNEGSSVCGDALFQSGAYAMACRKQAFGHPYFLQAINKGDHGMGGSELQVLARLTQWMKNENICGEPGQACEVIEATNPQGCEDVPLCPQGCMVSAIAPEISAGELAIHPNPAVDRVRITLPENQVYSGELTLSNAQGQVVLKQSFAGGAADLETGHLPAGWYLVQVRHSDHLAKGRLIVGVGNF